MNMKIFKCRNVKTPVRGTKDSAGIDFFVPDDYGGSKLLDPGEGVNIPSGIHLNIPKGYALIFFNKSGVSLNKQLQVGATVVDEDYQGEVHLHVINTGSSSVWIHPGEKLIQGLLLPINYATVSTVESLDKLYPEASERGAGGFGSTGTT